MHIEKLRGRHRTKMSSSETAENEVSLQRSIKELYLLNYSVNQYVIENIVVLVHHCVSVVFATKTVTKRAL